MPERVSVSTKDSTFEWREIGGQVILMRRMETLVTDFVHVARN
jgi:hypothetical protein